MYRGGPGKVKQALLRLGATCRTAPIEYERIKPICWVNGFVYNTPRDDRNEKL